MNVLYRLTATETKLVLREPIVVFFAVVLPPLLLTILGLVPSFREPNPDLGGARGVELYTSIVITMALAMLALSVLPQAFAANREKGVLRRMATTPVRPAALLAAQLLMCVALALFAMIVVLIIARAAFDVPLPGNIPGYVLGYLLSLVSMLTLGLLIAALASSSAVASGIGTILFFPVLFFAGLWAPRESMSELLRRISDFTPLGAGVQALSDASSGQWPQLLHMVVMVGWIVVTGGLAARFFRWQ